MIKVSRSGWLTFTAVILVIAGLLIYKYAYLVYRDYDYYTYYENIHGLQRSSPIYINGVRVGEVSEIDMNHKNKVRVTMSINKHIRIPKGSVALLASKGLLGDMMILMQTSNNRKFYTHKDFITGRYDTSILEMNDQVAPIVESAKYILSTADKNFSNFNRKLDNGLVEQTHRDARRMAKTMKRFSEQAKQISTSVADIASSLKNVNNQAADLAGKSSNLDTSLIKAETQTASLKNIPIVQTTEDIRASVHTINDQVIDITSSETAEKLLNDKSTYETATQKALDANSSLTEIKEHPKGISLIGGKK